MKNAAMRALLGPACLVVLPLAVWPGLSQPFDTPKLAWLTVATLTLWIVPPLRRPGRVAPALRWTTAAWVGAFLLAGVASPLPSPSALTLGLAAPLLGLALARDDAPASTVATAQVLGAVLCGAVALLQWAGTDPFALAGWRPPIDGASIRMRVYGTLGNPNFVGVLMAMTLPLTLALSADASTVGRRAWIALALVIQSAALVATGSRGAVLGLGAAVAVYASLRWSGRVRIALAVAAVLAGVALGTSPARPLDTTAAGRLHLWRIAAPHAWDAPLTGRGPGAVAARFPAWQRRAAREGVRDPRFAGLTDHVHNDYLEALIDRGLPGLVALVAPLGVLLVLTARVPRPVVPLLAGAAAAVAAGAACALVDFPLARPAELTWWWVSMAMAMQVAAAPGSPLNE